MKDWQQTFVRKLNAAQSQYRQAFERAISGQVNGAFEELGEFLGSNGFTLSTPVNEPGRHAFKFELSENAYVLMTFRAHGVGEFELRGETFAPNHEPAFDRFVGQIAELDREWATQRFQATLNGFVDRLAKSSGPVVIKAEEADELVVV